MYGVHTQLQQPARVLVLTRYERLGSSSRVRILQYLPMLDSIGGSRLEFNVQPLLPNDYLRVLYASGRRSIRHAAGGYLKRLAALAKSRSYDMIWLEKELLPFIPSWLENWLTRIGLPIVVDYDDAIFVQYRNNRNPILRWAFKDKIDRICAIAHTVVAGNEFLAQQSRRAGAKRVVVIPTTIDASKYQWPVTDSGNTRFHIGWIGSPVTAKYLPQIAPALAKLCDNPDTSLITVGAPELALSGVRQLARPWSEDNEARLLSDCDIAVAPLDNGEWEEGKCGYSIIQCMAAGLPTIASPVGVANSIIEHGVNGFLASGQRDYEAILRELRQDAGLRVRIGLAARETAFARFSTEAWQDTLGDVLASALRDGCVQRKLQRTAAGPLVSRGISIKA